MKLTALLCIVLKANKGFAVGMRFVHCDGHVISLYGHLLLIFATALFTITYIKGTVCKM